MLEDGIYCSDCKQKLDELLASRKPYACPECGGTKQTINVSIIEEIKIYDSLRGQAKSCKHTGKQKMRWDCFTGWDMNRSLGKMVKKSRIIDKDKNFYQEIVTDPDTNEIIYHCEEPLDQHVGHGSAKSKKS